MIFKKSTNAMLPIERAAMHRIGTENFDQQSTLVAWLHTRDAITIAPGA
jgi:hypothetical protein